MRVLTIVGFAFLFLCGASSCKDRGANADQIPKTETAPLAKYKPFIVELVQKSGLFPDTALLMDVCQQSGMSQPDMYRWKDHFVVYGATTNAKQLGNDLKATFPSAVVKIYEDPFYEFNRNRCTDKGTAKEWDHIILTANLVEDTVLQKEYMAYHATQFEQWPEVSNGFCNASFQQLLLFRNGRQLMLVISIPEGSSLEALNPKTTENNPRVDDWNALMKKYQEGIEGTKPGEVWVFLERQM